MAAVLAAGDGARLAGWSAATHRGVLPEAGKLIDVAIPSQRRVTLRGVRTRRAAAGPRDFEVVDGIPTHAVAPMLLDIAALNDAETLEWAWRQCIFRGLLDVRDVAVLLEARAGAHGAPALRALCERRAVLVGELRNRFEVRMLSIIREAGLPEPLCNAPFEVAPGLVLHPDFRIPELRLIIEADGRDGHADVEFQLSDERRDRLYLGQGYHTLRYGHWEARRERGRVVGELRAAAAGDLRTIRRA